MVALICEWYHSVRHKNIHKSDTSLDVVKYRLFLKIIPHSPQKAKQKNKIILLFGDEWELVIKCCIKVTTEF